jgi:hypothetical protein
VIYRDAQPLRAMGGFNPIPIPPAMFIILNVIIEYKHIRPVDLIKISSPGDIRGLQVNTAHRLLPDGRI